MFHVEEATTKAARLIPVTDGDNPTAEAFIPVLIPWELAYFGRPRLVKFPLPLVVDVASGASE